MYNMFIITQCAYIYIYSQSLNSTSWIRPPRLSDTDPDQWSLLKVLSLVSNSASPPSSASWIRPPWLSDADPDPWSLLKNL